MNTDSTRQSLRCADLAEPCLTAGRPTANKRKILSTSCKRAVPDPLKFVRIEPNSHSIFMYTQRRPSRDLEHAYAIAHAS